LVTLNLIMLALIGIIFKRAVLKDEQSVFIMELPLYHMPNPRTIGLYVWHNLLSFLQKAGVVILIASVVIWMLSYFPAQGDVMQSYLAHIGRALEPLGRLMGCRGRC
jgi:ferrous iron transport protein B